MSLNATNYFKNDKKGNILGDYKGTKFTTSPYL